MSALGPFGRMAHRLWRLRPDLTPLRESRDLRLVMAGDAISSLGAQASLVALPYQLYVETRSPLLVGLLGAAELVPLVSLALLGGAIADRMDRRALLLVSQAGLAATAAALTAVAAGHTPVALLYLLGALLAGFNSLQSVIRSAIVPNLVTRERMPQAIALDYGLISLTQVLGPGLGGLLIGVLSVRAAYGFDALCSATMVLAVVPMSRQPPAGGPAGESVLRSVLTGLRHVRSNRALVGSFAIDLVAMTFGMPRALFAVLAVSVYHAGAGGTGLLYASVSAGATVAALLTGWVAHARRLGRIVIGAVLVWGAAVAAAGTMESLGAAAALLAVAGGADSISAVCRSTINQTVTPDSLRGRMSSVFMLVVTSGPRLGDIESGTVAGLAGVRFSVVSGGLACLLGVGVIVLAFPALARFDTRDCSRPWLGSTPAIGG